MTITHRFQTAAYHYEQAARQLQAARLWDDGDAGHEDRLDRAKQSRRKARYWRDNRALDRDAAEQTQKGTG